MASFAGGTAPGASHGHLRRRSPAFQPGETWTPCRCSTGRINDAGRASPFESIFSTRVARRRSGAAWGMEGEAHGGDRALDAAVAKLERSKRRSWRGSSTPLRFSMTGCSDDREVDSREAGAGAGTSGTCAGSRLSLDSEATSEGADEVGCKD